MVLFFKLYLAHLISDFLLQPDSIAKNKDKPRALVKHAAIHVGAASVIVNADFTWLILAAILLISATHSLFDYIKAKLTSDGWAAFTVDQLAHLIVVLAAAMLLAGDDWKGPIESLRKAAHSKELFLYLCSYVGVIFGGGHLVQKVTAYFMKQIPEEAAGAKPGLRNAGKYIGWLERALIMTFLVAGFHQAIGFLLAAKAVVRYPEIKKDEENASSHFAEYFLVGTMTSMVLAVCGALFIIGMKTYFATQ